jgi:hypothetical protein
VLCINHVIPRRDLAKLAFSGVGEVASQHRPDAAARSPGEDVILRELADLVSSVLEKLGKIDLHARSAQPPVPWELHHHEDSHSALP